MRTRLIALACLALLGVMFPASSARAALSAERERDARALIAQFTDRRFSVRQQAVERLARMGPDVLPLVRRTLDETDDNEVRLRCRMVIDRLTPPPPEPERLVERVIRKFGPNPAGRDVRRTLDGEVASCIIQRDGRDVVVHWGQEQKPYDSVPYTSGTPDRKHIAYPAQHEGKRFMVRDGVEQPAYDEVTSPYWSDDGLHLAYIARQGARNERKTFMVVDDVARGPYDEVTWARHSETGGHFGWAALRDGKAFFVVDGVEGANYDCIHMASLDDRLKLRGVVVDRGEAWAVEIDWTPVGNALRERRVKSLGRVPPEFPGKGRRIESGGYANALVARFTRDGKRWVVHNGREMGPYDSEGWATVSDDGEHYAFGATRDGKQFAVVDGKEGSAYDEVRDFRLSTDGRRLAYRAKRDDAFFIVIDGRELRHSGYQKGRWFLYDMGFSPDSKHFYYVDRDEHGDFIVCDGYRGRNYAGISNARFSPDSRHLYFEATSDGLRRSVCDGLEGPGHGDIVQTRVDPETGRLRYLALRAEATLVELEWPANRDWQSGLEKLPD